MVKRNNPWQLEVDEKLRLLGYIEQWLSDVMDGRHESLSLTGKGFTPYDVWKVLEDLGYTSDDIQNNGWQQDFWVYLIKPESPTLVVDATGMTHEVNLYVDWEYTTMEDRDAKLAEILDPVLKDVSVLLERCKNQIGETD